MDGQRQTQTTGPGAQLPAPRLQAAEEETSATNNSDMAMAGIWVILRKWLLLNFSERERESERAGSREGEEFLMASLGNREHRCVLEPGNPWLLGIHLSVSAVTLSSRFPTSENS